jgi:hypothetical protein
VKFTEASGRVKRQYDDILTVQADAKQVRQDNKLIKEPLEAASQQGHASEVRT